MLRYQARISGPLLDRIDLQVEVPAVGVELLAAAPDGEASSVVRQRVAAARALATVRQGTSNAGLAGDALELHCQLDPAASRFRHLAESRDIVTAHLGEAIQYRRVLQTR